MLLSKLENKNTCRTTQGLVLVFVVLFLSSCSAINESIKTVTGSQKTAKEDTKEQAKYAKDAKDALDDDIKMDETPVAKEEPPLITFKGRDPMAKVKINGEIKRQYQQAAQLVKLKKYSQAIKLLEGLKAAYPQLSGPDYQLARIYYTSNNLDKALEAINKSIEKNQRNYYSINFKGVVLRALGKFEEAKQSYLQAIKIYPPYPNAHLNLGVLADIYLGELDLALLEYRTYMQLNSSQDKQVKNWIIEIERRIKSGG